MYATRLAHGPVDLAFTDRFGGVSAAPFDSLNLSLPPAERSDGPDAVVGDDPATLAENHRLLLADFAPGARLADVRQVHGADVVEVGGPPDSDSDPDPAPGRRPTGDALVCTVPDVVLMVRAADCLPVLLADPERGVIGAAHAGRPGLAAGVVPALVHRMRERGAGRLLAWLGPHVCGGCYEVPEQMRDEVGAIEPASVATTTWGTPSIDIGAGVRAQLEREGVQVTDVARCTRESSDLYSYRRDGARSGRIAGLVRLRAASGAGSGSG